MCKILSVKPGKALDFLNKWSMKLDQGNFDDSFDLIRFSKEVQKRQPDTEDKLRQKKERAIERKKEWLEKNREAMNSRKRELYAEKKALKQQQMYSRFKIALTQNKSRSQYQSPESMFQPQHGNMQQQMWTDRDMKENIDNLELA